MVKSALLALCGLTIAAVVYLTTSVVVLRPPRANLSAWLPFAALLVAQCLLTFVAASRPLSWLRWLVAAGGAGLVAVGASMVRGTLSSEHFEGYALILGAMLVLQGVVTVAAFFRTHGLTHATS